jgi:hypothetical protein
VGALSRQFRQALVDMPFTLQLLERAPETRDHEGAARAVPRRRPWNRAARVNRSALGAFTITDASGGDAAHRTTPLSWPNGSSGNACQ